MDFPTPLDVDKICRVCMRSDQDMFLIFDDKYAEEELTIAAMLNECTRYKVERFDELPHMICGVCMTAVREAFRFKQECEMSYRKLVELLSSNNADKKPPSAIKLETERHSEKSTQTDSSALYPCELCEEKYFTSDELKAHRDIEHKGCAIVCRFCSKTFNRIGYLKTHIAVFHPESGYTSHNQCHVCQRQFTRREHMRRHLAVIHKIVESVDDDVPETNEVDQPHMMETESQIHSGDNVTTNTIEELPMLFQSEDEINDNSIAQYGSEHDAGGSVNKDNEKALQSSDDDEKPLSNFLMPLQTKGFMEVLLNDSPSVDLELNENLNIKRERSLSPSQSQEEDVLLPVKRGRGRPPRIVKKLCELSDDEEEEEDKLKCEECDKVFLRRSTLKRHMLNHAEEKQFACKICSKSFTRCDYLKSHISSIHSASKVMKCDKCDQVFTHITQYKRHKETKHSEKSYKCEICEKRFTTKLYLQRHVSTIHEKKRYVCKECSLSYATKEELSAHIKADGHDKPMLCPECGLRCKTSNILMVHLRRHNGEKPFKCKFCSKGFPRMDDLRVHEKYHTGEKSHFCETCGKGFQRKYNLTIHLRVHTGEKPYKCPHCPQAFAQGNDLKAHIRRHTGERFRCEVCGAAFLQGYQIRQHKLMEHGIKEDPPTQRVAKFTSPEEQEQQIKQNLQKQLVKDMNDPVELSSASASQQPSESTTTAISETMEEYMNI